MAVSTVTCSALPKVHNSFAQPSPTQCRPTKFMTRGLGRHLGDNLCLRTVLIHRIVHLRSISRPEPRMLKVLAFLREPCAEPCCHHYMGIRKVNPSKVCLALKFWPPSLCTLRVQGRSEAHIRSKVDQQTGGCWNTTLTHRFTRIAIDDLHRLASSR